MARIYSKKRGKSGSKRPAHRAPPSWLSYDKTVVEQLVVKLAKQGLPASQIGLVLRDTYGIPDVKAVTGKKIHTLLTDGKLSPKLPDDLTALIKKDIVIMKHLVTNKKDVPSLRGLQLTESKIGRLARHYKETGKLPSDWSYDRTKARLLIEQ